MKEITNKKLNIKQKEIILDDNKYILVTAGAGTGKTTTIIEKIKYLIKYKNIKENEIICISFTNESSDNLKEKLNKKYNYQIKCFTFHKLSLNIIKNRNYQIANKDLLSYVINEFFSCLIYQNINNIKRVLNYLNIKYNKRNILNKYQNINYTKINEIKKIVKTFINLFKTYSNNYKDIFTFIKKEKNKKYKNLLIIICYVFLTYKEELSSTHSLDLDDIIQEATNYIKKNNIQYGLKYLIIDEFQDTSNIKFELVKAIQKQTNCNLFVVGDDFQSIYKFTGCDLNIFLNFENYFPNISIHKLEETYRNCNELVKVAGNFIMKNKKQIPKKLYSQKHIKKPIIIVHYKNITKSFIEVINSIYKENKNEILILGRNNSDIDNIIKHNMFTKEDNYIKYLKNRNIKIKFLTVHSAKGLEYDNVIILNLINKTNGFPNQIKNNKILKHVEIEDTGITFSEERRLFYVALTRTKNKCYLFTKKSEESVFIKELKKDYKDFIAYKKDKH